MENMLVPAIDEEAGRRRVASILLRLQRYVAPPSVYFKLFEISINLLRQYYTIVCTPEVAEEVDLSFTY